MKTKFNTEFVAMILICLLQVDSQRQACY